MPLLYVTDIYILCFKCVIKKIEKKKKFNIFCQTKYFSDFFMKKQKFSEMVKKICYYTDFMILKPISRSVFLNFEWKGLKNVFLGKKSVFPRPYSAIFFGGFFDEEGVGRTRRERKWE